MISVILPVYNVEKYIRRAIDSLLKQTLGGFEVIIVDDCGEDRSIEIANQIIDADPRFRIIKNRKNLGTYHARRIGVENALGECIVFLDPDDELAPDTLNFINDEFYGSDVDIVFYGVQFIPPGRWYKQSPVLYPNLNGASLIVSYLKLKHTNYVWGTSGKAFRKSILISVYAKLNVDINLRFVYAEDALLFFAVMLDRPKYSVLHKQGYLYHKNVESISFRDDRNTILNRAVQFEYFMNRFTDLSEQTNLSEQEVMYIDCLKRQLQAERYLLDRHLGDRIFYIKNVFKAIRVMPTIKNVIRAGLYMISFGFFRK